MEFQDTLFFMPLHFAHLRAHLAFACCLLLSTVVLFAAEREVRIDFHQAAVVLRYDEAMLLPLPLRVDETALKGAYQQLAQRAYQRFFDDMEAAASHLQLNDWLYAQLLQQALAYIYNQPEVSPMVQLNTYFFLAKRGYDVRLTYRDKTLGVNAYTRDQLYEVATIQSDGRPYANVTHRTQPSSRGQAFYLLDHRPTPTGRPFSFLMRAWPTFSTVAQERAIAFNWGGDTYEIPIRYADGIADLMADYPLVDEFWYLDAPLSDALAESLLPQLSRLLAGRSQAEQVSLLAAFSRSGFTYKEDGAVFGKNKPMVADELFYYPYSDCEDRSALFFALVKRLLHLPMAVIAYDDHITIGVAIEGFQGDAIRHDGKTYFFCDPTGPNTSDKIGVIPNGYAGKSFSVMGVYGGE